MIKSLIILFILCGAVNVCAGLSPDNAKMWQDFKSQYCVNCHGPEKQKGKFRIDNLDLKIKGNQDYELIAEVRELINSNEMPPEGKKQPTQKEKDLIEVLLGTYLQDLKSSKKIKPASSIVRRLTKRQYINTLEDLLKIEIPQDYFKGIPDDRFNSEKFDTIHSDLRMSPFLLNECMKLSDQLVEYIRFDGNKPKSKIQKAINFASAGFVQSKDRKNRKWDLVVGVNGGKQNYMNTRSKNLFTRGYYKVTVKAQALHIGNVEKTLQKKLKGYNGKKTPILSVHFKTSTKNERLFRHQLIDNEIHSFSYESWFNPGDIISLGFENGPSIKRDQLEKALNVKNEDLFNANSPRIRIHEFIVEGPFYKQWPPQCHEQLYGTGNIRKKIEDFCTRAFRRKVSESEISFYEKLYSKNGIESVIKAVLTSPDLVYHVENDGRLNGTSLASRLSYSLTGTMPDDELLSLGISGKLLNREVYKKQILRLMGSSGFQEFTEDFVTQWLHLYNIDRFLPDAKKFRFFYRQGLKESILEEPVKFVDFLLKKDLPLSFLLETKYSMLNDQLAEYYGVKDFEGIDYKPVDMLKLSQGRGGLLGMAGVLTASANGVDTSPVVRGIYVLKNILGSRVPDPPEQVLGELPDLNGVKTVREMLEKHRNTESCNRCHKSIDPIGFALENFDAVGKWRDTYLFRGKKKLPIDSSGTMPGGEKFNDLNELKKLLEKHKEEVAANFVEQLLSYFTGREMTALDKEEIRKICKLSQKDNFKIKSLIIRTLYSSVFLRK